jgi:hypothetical protein
MANALYIASQQSNLYIFNPGLQFPSNDLGQLTYGGNNLRITAMAWDSTTSTFYAVTGNADVNHPHYLVTLDPADGTVALIGDLGAGQNCGDISIDSSGEIYGWRAGNNGHLVHINKSTGAGTGIGTTTDWGGGGVAFVGSIFYYIDANSPQKLWTVNLSTGARTLVATMSGSTAYANGAEYHNGIFFFVDYNNLYSLNLSSGLSTYVTFLQEGPFDSIASVPIPPAPSPPPPPSNDDWTNAQEIFGLSGSVAGILEGATPDWPSVGGNPGFPNVWYKWTPTRSGVASFRVSGLNNVFVWTGSTLSGLSLVSSYGAEFNAVAGVTYYISVDPL